MRSEVDVVRAFLACEEGSWLHLQSEVRAGRPTTDPRSGAPVEGLPTVVLWDGEQPVAALIGSVVLINRAAREAETRRQVAGEAERRGYEVQHVREPDLWRLTA